MKRTQVFDEAELTRVLQQAKRGEQFRIKDAAERKRVYQCATCAGRQISTRHIKDGEFKATVIE
jgi:hypothetical protein